MWPILIAFKINWLLAINLTHQASLWMLSIAVLMLVLSYRCHSGWSVAYCIGLAGLGCSIDLTLLHWKLISFQQDALPLFMVVLWLSFALVLPYFKNLLNHHFIWVMIFAGPLSYYFAEKLGVLQFHPSTLSVVLVMGLAWGGLAWIAKQVLGRTYA